jgi:hypothetical protein
MVISPVVKHPGYDPDYLPPSSANVKKRGELNFYFLSVSSWKFFWGKSYLYLYFSPYIFLNTPTIVRVSAIHHRSLFAQFTHNFMSKQPEHKNPNDCAMSYLKLWQSTFPNKILRFSEI